jgi:glycosyltransferase involved in cell wall biosynthesis
VRVCLVYDCLYPYTIGGGERWYRNLAETLAENGYDVTYLTLRQWDPGNEPRVEGIRIAVAGPRMPLYSNGRRRVAPPLVFGLGVFWHLLRHGRSYDIVHTSAFPYFSLLAAGALRARGRYRLFVDWFEVWTRGYWREYLGSVAGSIGWEVQKRCLRIRQRAFCFSRLHERRLEAEGIRGPVTRLDGLYDGEARPGDPLPAEPVVVYAGRHIPEKRVPALVAAFAEARRRVPALRCEVYGDGPDREKILRAIDDHGLGDVVHAPGFVEADRLEAAIGGALCLVLPSRREGYGLVILEAAAHGTPSIVVEGPDNAAVELVEPGVNGAVAPSASPGDLADAIVRVHEAGYALRASTADWFRRSMPRLSVSSSVETVCAAYAAAAGSA